MSFKKHIIPLILLLVAVSCSNTSSDTENIPVEIGDKRIAVELMDSLKGVNIDFVQVDADSILVTTGDAERVITILNVITEQYLPANRNVDFTEDQLPKVLASLNENNVSYKVVDVYGRKWITWDFEEDEAIKEIFSSIPPSKVGK